METTVHGGQQPTFVKELPPYLQDIWNNGGEVLASDISKACRDAGYTSQERPIKIQYVED